MKQRIILFALILTTLLCAGQASTQALPQLPGGNVNFLLPANPTSADNLKLSMGRGCSGDLPYKANAFEVFMGQNNNIIVRRGEIRGGIISICGPGPREEIDLGRLPAGNYTLTVIDNPNNPPYNPPLSPGIGGDVFSNVPFTVRDARAAKTAPYVRRDYSGHWWDPNDPGWGLFIWHDARDNVLAAWFTYGTDGKPIWYTFQPGWDTFAATLPALLSQTSRMPGTTTPPPNPTSYVAVGTASLDFTIIRQGVSAAAAEDAGKLTYAFTGGPTTVRNIQRFKP